VTKTVRDDLTISTPVLPASILTACSGHPNHIQNAPSSARFYPQQNTLHTAASANMAIFGPHVLAAAPPPNTRLISAPLYARYVSGVCVQGEPSTVEKFFAPSNLEPDETPSHTFVASGKKEIPRKPNTLRRPSLSLRRSLSRLRSNSPPTVTGGHRRCQSEKDAEAPPSQAQSDSACTSPRLSRQSSATKRSWPSLGLSRNVVFDAAPRYKIHELDAIPEPPSAKGDSFPIIAATTCIHAITTDAPNPAPTTQKKKPLPVRPKRADSGTGSEFNDFVFDEEPKCFSNMVAMQAYEERMALYDSMPNYWTTTEYGLGDWNGGIKGL
jgi:hypothetical protein